MLIKHLLTEKNTHLGGEVRFGYLHIPLHSELYLTKEVKQKFKWFGIPLKEVTQLDCVQFPTEIVSLMTYATQQWDAGVPMWIGLYKEHMIEVAKEVREQYLSAIIKSLGETNTEQAEELEGRLVKDELYLDVLLADESKDEANALKSFLQDDYNLAYRVVAGATTTYYLVKELDDRLSFIIVDLMSFGRGKKLSLKISNIKSFYITQTYMQAFLKEVDKKAGLI